jgi:putative DNA primase/helicase
LAQRPAIACQPRHERLQKCPNGRAVGLFAGIVQMIGEAGELARELDVLPWPAGEARRAAEVCFAAWLENRGGAGQLESEQFVERVRSFIGQHGAARFERLDGAADFIIQKRAGWRWGDGQHGELYGILPAVWKTELMAGLDARAAAKELLARGWLVRENDKPQARKRIGEVVQRLYVVKASIMSGSATALEAAIEAAEHSPASKDGLFA